MAQSDSPAQPDSDRPGSPRQQPIDTIRGYDLWAPSYDDTANTLVALDDEVARPCVGEIAGQRVVDAGCGTGRHTEWLAQTADKVWAIDASTGMLDRARQRLAGQERVEFVQHDLNAPPCPLDAGAADGVLCALVGEHLTELGQVFDEFARLLRPGGWLVFTVYHPFQATVGKEANFTAGNGSVEYRLGAVKHQVSDYVNALLAAGLSLRVFREFVIDRDLAARLPNGERYLDQPYMLLLRGVLEA